MVVLYVKFLVMSSNSLLYESFDLHICQKVEERDRSFVNTREQVIDVSPAYRLRKV